MVEISQAGLEGPLRLHKNLVDIRTSPVRDDYLGKKEEENNLFSLPMHCKPMRTFLGDTFSTTGFWDYFTPLTHPVHFYSDYFIIGFEKM